MLIQKFLYFVIRRSNAWLFLIYELSFTKKPELKNDCLQACDILIFLWYVRNELLFFDEHTLTCWQPCQQPRVS